MARHAPELVAGMDRNTHGAYALGRYIRYYYSISRSDRRIIGALYVERSWLNHDRIPASGIVVVDEESEIPAPYDAECAAVIVRFDPSRDTKVDASCSAGLISKP